MPWYRKLSQRGWIAPHWPREFGGMDASPVEQVILLEESARIGAPDYPSQGLNQIGPILQRFGSQAQKDYHLPRILNGDVIWCQGYSEPNSGSDLASLRTAGVVDGDHVVITGHKIWTTWGHHADWMYALVRTNKDAPKRRGISFVLIDLKTPGITRQPILTLAGEHEFCEVFFDNVRVPIGNVVGGLDNGWTIATSLLTQERLLLGAPGNALRAFERLRRIAEALGPGLSEAGRDRIAAATIELETLVAAFLDAAEDTRAGRPVDASYLKIMATETTQFILDVAQTLCGPWAALKARPSWAARRSISAKCSCSRAACRSTAARTKSSASSSPPGFSTCRGSARDAANHLRARLDAGECPSPVRCAGRLGARPPQRRRLAQRRQEGLARIRCRGLAIAAAA